MKQCTMKLVVYIAPSSGELHHPQARIYARLFDKWQLRTASHNMRDCYNEQPGQWRECGLMNYEGKLVCFNGPREALEELQDSQPLMAGTFFTYDYDPKQEVSFARMEGTRGNFQSIPKEKRNDAA